MVRTASWREAARIFRVGPTRDRAGSREPGRGKAELDRDSRTDEAAEPDRESRADQEAKPDRKSRADEEAEPDRERLVVVLHVRAGSRLFAQTPVVVLRVRSLFG